MWDCQEKIDMMTVGEKAGRGWMKVKENDDDKVRSKASKGGKDGWMEGCEGSGLIKRDGDRVS